ncbi:MAG: hypothetical protein HY784_00145 [Chloroflexi bacterium]|nr:hypothetical protein [Chloroflexota bacterium]
MDQIRNYGDEEEIPEVREAPEEEEIPRGWKPSEETTLAAHLAHGGTHVGWDKPYRISSFGEFAEDYVDEEYQAFKSQDGVWRAAKEGNETNDACDAVSQVVARGEAEARATILRAYGDMIVQDWLRVSRRSG